MADRHVIDGEITINPPVTPEEITKRTDEHGAYPQKGDGPYLHVPAKGDQAGHGTEIRFCGQMGDDPVAWYSGDDGLAEAVQEIVDGYRRAPDGTERTFTGWLDCVAQCGEGDSPYRVGVVDGKAEIFEPAMGWPPEVSTQPAAVTDIDVDGLPASQYLLLEVLAARYRLGEYAWTFPTSARPALRKLAERGLVEWKAGSRHKTVLAWLTDSGRAASLSPDWRPKPESVAIATANTGPFTFMAAGHDAAAAVAALMAAWQQHAAITGADPTYLTADDPNVVGGPLGQAWRDGSPFPPD